MAFVFLMGLIPAGLSLADSHTPAGSTFSDVPADHPDRAHIEHLAEHSLINGYPDERFGVADPLNRAAAAKIATQLAGLAARPSGETLPFADLPGAHWSVPYVRAALESGLIQGFEDGTLRPDQPLTRAELAVLAIRAIRQSTERLPSLTLSDVDSGDWFYRPALLAVAAGLMEAPDGKFRPNDFATRAEAARAFAQAMVYTPLAFDTPLAVVVVPQQGVVEIQQPGDALWSPISKATTLAEGGRVRTAGASAASVDFPDGSSLYLENLTELIVHRSRGTQLVEATGVEDLDVELVRGKLLFALTPRLSADEAAAYGPALAAFNNPDADLRAARDLAPRVRAASSHSGENLPDAAARLLLFVDPASLEPGDENGAELTIVLADEAGEPVTADKGPVTLELLTDVGSFSNASPVIPEGYNAVTVTVYPPAEEPEDQKTRITAVAGEITSSLTVPTSTSSWWSNLFAKKTRAKVRMPWSVASVRGTLGLAEVTPGKNSTTLMTGDASLTSNNGDTTDVGQNEGASLNGPDDSPDNGPMSEEDQESFSNNQDWIQDTTRNQSDNANDNNRDAVDTANQIINNLMQNLPKDTTAPTIAIGSPANEQHVGTPTVTVSGSASDNAKLASVSVGGAMTGVDANGSWSASVALQPGLNTITATATDGAGNTSSTSVTVTYDAAHPTITLSGPEQTKESKVALSGTVTAPGGVQSVTVNGTAVTVGENGGSFSVDLDLQPGVNAITAEVTDRQGKSASAELQITSANLPPLVSISAGEAVVGKENYTVGGRATAQYAKLASVTVNGAPVLFSADGSFTASVKLKLGDNEISVSATDTAGNVGTASTTVKLDAAAPAVRIQQPRDGLITKEAQITVQGVATAALGVRSLSVGGQTLPAEPGPFSVTIPLQEGENVITASLTGTSGRTASDSKTVVRLTKPPTLVLSSPDSGLKSAKRQVTVSGAAAASYGPLRSVTVNGQTVPLSAGGSFSATITLQNGDNQISVVATDMAGNSTSESRTVSFNPQAATLTLSSPQNGLVTKQSTVTVSGSLTNGEAVEQVTVNGVAATVSGGSFSAAVPLAPGKNTITVALPADAGGATDSVTVTYADRAPSLSVGAPADGQVLAKPEITVSGSALTSYGTPAVVTVNGMAVPVSSGGAFSRTVELKPGKTTITVSATDAAGNTASESRTVEYKPALPIISIGAPAEGFLTKEATVTVSGTVTSAVGVASVSVNGAAASVSATGSFSASVELKPGANTITVTATDKLQQTASATVTVQRGGLPPELSIGSPSDGFVSGSRTVTVSGSAKAVAGRITSVSVNGAAAAVSPDGSWTAAVTLAPGQNTIAVTATDSLGGSASASRQVTVAEGAPTLEITAPAGGTTVTTNRVTVTGRVKASTPTFSVSVNGTAASAGSDGSFSASVALVPGPNTISVSVTDALNRTASGSVTVTFAGEKPSISISAPAETADATVTVSGSVKVATGLTVTSVTVNGSAVSASGGSFSAPVQLQKGSNTITASVTDSLGRTETASTTVTFTPAAPTISLSAPSSTQSASVTVTGSVSSRYGEVRVSVGGQSFTYTGSGSFSATVSLTEGANTITATAADQYGSASASATITYTQPQPPPPPPPAAPTVSITNPHDNQWVDAAFLLQGTYTAAGGLQSVTYRIDDSTPVSVTTATTGNDFSAMVLLPVTDQGPNEFSVTVEVTDTLGRKATDTVQVEWIPVYATAYNVTSVYGETAQLKAELGRADAPAPGKLVEFYVGNGKVGEATSDDSGIATLTGYTITKPAGTYTITVKDPLRPNVVLAEAVLEVLPIEAWIHSKSSSRVYLGEVPSLFIDLGVELEGDESDVLSGTEPKVQIRFLDSDYGTLATKEAPITYHVEGGYRAQYLGANDENFKVPSGTRYVELELLAGRYYTGSVLYKMPRLYVSPPASEVETESLQLSGYWSIDVNSDVQLLTFGSASTTAPDLTLTNYEGALGAVTLVDGHNTIVGHLVDSHGMGVKTAVTTTLKPVTGTLTLPSFVDYSDMAILTITLQRGSTPVPGRTVWFQRGGMTMHEAVTGASGTATYDWQALVTPGTISLQAAGPVQEGGSVTYDQKNIMVTPEKATLEYFGGTPVQGSTVDLKARFVLQDDGSNASLLSPAVKVQFMFMDSTGGSYEAEANVNAAGEAVLTNVHVPEYATKLKVLLYPTSYYTLTQPGPEIAVQLAPLTATLSASPVTVDYSDTTHLSAELRRAGATVSGQSVEFWRRSNTGTEWTLIGSATSGPSGVASLAYKVGVAPGTYWIKAVDPAATATSTGDPIQITVKAEKLDLVSFSGYVFEGEQPRLQARLAEGDSSFSAIPAEGSVAFVFLDGAGDPLRTVTASLVPSGDGEYIADFYEGTTAPSTTAFVVPPGTKAIKVSPSVSTSYTAGDTTYAMPTLDVAPVPATVYTEVIKLSGTWTASSAATITVDGYGVTQGDGTFEYDLQLRPGFQTYQVRLVDYRGLGVRRQVTTTLPNLVPHVSIPTQVEYGDKVTFAITLKRGEMPIAGRPLKFQDGNTDLGVVKNTDSTGTATHEWQGLVPGDHLINIRYPNASGEYVQVYDSRWINVIPEKATLVYTGATPVQGGSIHLAAKVVPEDDGSNAPFPATGVALRFQFVGTDSLPLGAPIEANADASGVARTDTAISVPGNAAGLKISFAPNGYYFAPSEFITQPVELGPLSATLSATATKVQYSDNAELTVELRRNGEAVPGKLIALYISGNGTDWTGIGTTATNSLGIAHKSHQVSQSPGPYWIKAVDPDAPTTAIGAHLQLTVEPEELERIYFNGHVLENEPFHAYVELFENDYSHIALPDGSTVQFTFVRKSGLDPVSVEAELVSNSIAHYSADYPGETASSSLEEPAKFLVPDGTIALEITLQAGSNVSFTETFEMPTLDPNPVDNTVYVDLLTVTGSWTAETGDLTYKDLYEDWHWSSVPTVATASSEPVTSPLKADGTFAYTVDLYEGTNDFDLVLVDEFGLGVRKPISTTLPELVSNWDVPETVEYGDEVPFAVTLKRSTTLVTSGNVSFFVNGEEKPADSFVAGVATLTLPALVPGYLSLDANYENVSGRKKYLAYVETQVAARAATLQYTGETQLDGGTLQLEARLTPKTPGSLSDITKAGSVQFVIQRKSDGFIETTVTAPVNAAGVAATSTTLPAMAYTIHVNLLAHDYYSAPAITAHVDGVPTLSVSDASGQYSRYATLTATLADGAGGVTGKAVSFTVNGVHAGTAATGSSGVASITYPVELAAGTYTVAASFAGDDDYAAASDTGALTVAREDATLAYTGETLVPHGTVQFGAVMTPAHGPSADLSSLGLRVAFRLIDSSGATVAGPFEASVDAYGKAIVATSVTIPLHAVGVEMQLLPNSYYTAPTKNEPVTQTLGVHLSHVPAVTTSAELTLTGSWTAPAGLSKLTVNAMELAGYSGTSGTFSHKLTLTPGYNTLTVTVRDVNGQESYASVSVEYMPPEIVATVRASLTTVPYSDLTELKAVLRLEGEPVANQVVKFYISDDGEHWTWIGEATSDAAGNATFSYQVDVVPGAYEILVWVADEDHPANDTPLALTVVADALTFVGIEGYIEENELKSLSVELTDGDNHDSLHSAPGTVAFEFLNAPEGSVLGSVTGQLFGDETPGSYYAVYYGVAGPEAFLIPPGTTTLRVRLDGAKGFTFSKSVALPQLTVDSVPATVYDDLLVVQGDWSTGGIAPELHVNGESVTPSADGTFQHAVRLYDSIENTIFVQLTGGGIAVSRLLTTTLPPLDTNVTFSPVVKYGDTAFVEVTVKRGQQLLSGKTVKFKESGTVLGTVSTVNGVARFESSTLAPGYHYVDVYLLTGSGEYEWLESATIHVDAKLATLQYTGPGLVSGGSVKLAAKLVPGSGNATDPFSGLDLKLRFALLDKYGYDVESPVEAMVGAGGLAETSEVNLPAYVATVRIELVDNTYYATESHLDVPVYQAPTVEFDYMETETTDPSFNVVGDWTAPAGVQGVWLNGTQLPDQTGTQGSFGKDVTLVSGSNTITVRVVDVNGHEVSRTFTVTLLSAALVFEGGISFNDYGQIGLNVSEGVTLTSGTPTLKVNGVAVPLDGSEGRSYWWYYRPLLMPGEYPVVAYDGDTPLASGTLKVRKGYLSLSYYMGSPVVAEIPVNLKVDNVDYWEMGDNPANYVGAVTFDFQDKDGKSLVKHPGIIETPSGEGGYSFSVSGGSPVAPPGTAQLVISHAGSAYYEPSTVTIVGPGEPTVSITSPADGSVVYVPEVRVSGYWDAPASVDGDGVAINAEPLYDRRDSGAFTNVLVGNLHTGENPITAVLTDTVDRTVWHTIKVFYVKPQAAVPDVSIGLDPLTTPISATVTANGQPLPNFPVTVRLSGALLGNGMELGTVSTDASGKVVVTLPELIPNGIYTITVSPASFSNEILNSTGTLTMGLPQ